MNLEEVAMEGGTSHGSLTDFALFGSPSGRMASLVMPGMMTNGNIPEPPVYSAPNSGPSSAGDVKESYDQIWPERFAANFIEPGPCLYKATQEQPKDEMVLLEADVLEKMARSLVGKPVVDWDHADVWPSMIAEGESDGIVTDVWKEADGWWHCAFIVWTKDAIEHCKSGAWHVSCAYVPTRRDMKAGTHHSIPYTEKVLDGEYTHLALVKNPRYEKARIRANSKTGGYKMAFKWLNKPKPSALRLNAGDEEVLVDVDGEAVPMAELVSAMAEQERQDRVLSGADEDEIEMENGAKVKLGALRQAHRNRMNRRNAEEKERKEKEEKDRKNREEKERRDRQEREHGAADGGGQPKDAGAEDNPPHGTEAAHTLSEKSEKDLKERLQAAEDEAEKLRKENHELKNGKSAELRNAADLRGLPPGGAPQAVPFLTKQDRIKAGRERMNSASQGSVTMDSLGAGSVEHRA